MTSSPVLAQGSAPAPAPLAPVTFLFSKPGKGQAGTPVDASMPYDAARGYGFVSAPGGNEQAFSLRVPPGDYAVTVTLGGATASRTTIWAEDRRLMAEPVILKKGETRTVQVIVNVRDAALVPSEHDDTPAPKVRLHGYEDMGRDWDDQLTIGLSGTAPLVQSISVAPVAARRILLAGDSTVTDQQGGDYASWGQMLPRFMGPGFSVANHARSGETMKSFIGGLRWDKLMADTRPGDVVLIQFAHNDEKKQWPRTYAAADGAYPSFLAALVADVRQHGASPVLVTPVARRSFDKAGKIQNTHEGYDAAVRDVAVKLDVPLIDLTAKTARMYEALGPELAPLAFGNHGQDKTHHNAYGAYMIACFVARDLGGFSGLGVKTADLPDCQPDHPADPHSFVIEAGDWPVLHTNGAQGAEPTPVK